MSSHSVVEAQAYAKAEVKTNYPLRRIMVYYGYKERDSLQLRMDPEDTGAKLPELDEYDKVYLSYTASEGRDIRAVTLPFEEFKERYMKFVDGVIEEKHKERQEAALAKLAPAERKDLGF